MDRDQLRQKDAVQTFGVIGAKAQDQLATAVLIDQGVEFLADFGKGAFVQWDSRNRTQKTSPWRSTSRWR